jgi:hypothetical protein
MWIGKPWMRCSMRLRDRITTAWLNVYWLTAQPVERGLRNRHPRASPWYLISGESRKENFMTIEEAIKILNAISPKARAIQLGIEALRQVQRLRPNLSYANATRLPGETEEEEAHSSTG